MKQNQEFEKLKLQVPLAWKRYYRMYPTEAWHLLDKWRCTVQRRENLLRKARYYVSLASVECEDAQKLLRKIDVEINRDWIS